MWRPVVPCRPLTPASLWFPWPIVEYVRYLPVWDCRFPRWTVWRPVVPCPPLTPASLWFPWPIVEYVRYLPAWDCRFPRWTVWRPVVPCRPLTPASLWFPWPIVEYGTYQPEIVDFRGEPCGDLLFLAHLWHQPHYGFPTRLRFPALCCSESHSVWRFYPSVTHSPGLALSSDKKSTLLSTLRSLDKCSSCNHFFLLMIKTEVGKCLNGVSILAKSLLLYKSDLYLRIEVAFFFGLHWEMKGHGSRVNIVKCKTLLKDLHTTCVLSFLNATICASQDLHVTRVLSFPNANKKCTSILIFMSKCHTVTP